MASIARDAAFVVTQRIGHVTVILLLPGRFAAWEMLARLRRRPAEGDSMGASIDRGH